MRTATWGFLIVDGEEGGDATEPSPGWRSSPPKTPLHFRQIEKLIISDELS